MTQNQKDRSTDRHAGEAVFDELRVLIRDVRSWLGAMPVPAEPLWVDIAPLQDAVHSASVGSARAAPDVVPDAAQLDGAVAALDANADMLSATASRASEAARERGDRIDAMLAEISRVRAETLHS